LLGSLGITEAMLELLDLDDLETLADSLPGPHAWTHGTADIFVCQACYVAFEFGADPVPDGPCEPLDPALISAVYFDPDSDAEPDPANADVGIDDDDEEPF
jgi:hypothetical protein